MLMSVVVKEDQDSQDAEIEIPKFSNFVKNAYVQAARVHYNNPGILSEGIAEKHRLAITRELNSANRLSITAALQMMVPLQEIIPATSAKEVPRENYDELGEEEDDDDSESEPEPEEDHRAKKKQHSDDSASESSESDDSEDDSESDSGSGSGSGSGSDSEEEDSSSSEEETPRRRRKTAPSMDTEDDTW